MRLLAIIPARDECRSLPATVAELGSVQPALRILVVDDGSTDGTAELLPSLPVPWLRLPIPLGIGGAMRAGMRHARRDGPVTVVRLDADGQHPPQAIASLLAPIESGRADVVIASRYLQGPPPPLGKRLLARAISLAARQRLTDPTSGFGAFGPRAVDLLARHHPTGYPEPELLLLCRRNGLSIVEVPVAMRPRRAGRTSLTPTRAVVALVRALLALVVVPLRTAER